MRTSDLEYLKSNSYLLATDNMMQQLLRTVFTSWIKCQQMIGVYTETTHLSLNRSTFQRANAITPI